jgi:2',3'-cyclic-nucleotide 2'-phosphodiesterase (5'-nucleotidase family)
MAHPSRSLLLLIALPVLMLPGSRATNAAPPAPASSLVLVATTDLRGETSPCGCHTPRGGFARIGSLVDSLRREDRATAYLDAGGFFPDLSTRSDLAAFMVRMLREIAPVAVGVAPRDLHLGPSVLVSLVREAGLPVTCANLVDRRTGAPLFPTTRLVDVGGVKLGVFALLGERFELGAARDTVLVTDPELAAQKAIAALRAQGAQVVVLLSQLGRVGGEDIATAVPGIDAVFLGRDAPILEHGRRVGAALVSYAGERGQHVGVIRLALDAKGKVADGTIDVASLDPGVREHPALLSKVKAFEDAYNERMRKEQLGAQAAEGAENDPVDHFVGDAVCARCHTAEAAQWKTTAHSLAWETLVREKKDATPDCVPCHVVGYRQPGGFQTAASTPHLVNVQCENCHGMGTSHGETMAESAGKKEQACRTCHNPERDPEFDFEKRLPLIMHGNTSGESIRIVKERRERNGGRMR